MTGRNRPGLLLTVVGQRGSVGACVAMREAVPVLRRASVRRMGEGALAAGGGVWLPRPVACVRMPSTLGAGMRSVREGSGVGDNIRVITGRGLEAGRPGFDCLGRLSAAGKPLFAPGHHALAGRSTFALPHRLWAARSRWDGTRRTLGALHHLLWPESSRRPPP